MTTSFDSLLDENACFRASDRTDAFPSWCSFLLGGMITFFLVYVGIARPMRQELTSLRDEIRLMQTGLEQVVALKPSAKATQDLVATLAGQQAALVQARQTWYEVELLRSRIAKESAQLTQASQTIGQLAELKSAVLATASDIPQAKDALLQQECLQEQLVGASRQATTALEIGRRYLSLGEELAAQAVEIEETEKTVKRWLTLGDQLSDRSQLDVTLDRVHDLLLLKDTVLARTVDLADAIETLELTADLSAQYRKAALAFAEMRQWMLEIVASEPLVKQAKVALEPLFEMANLRRMEPEELRAVARTMLNQWKTSTRSEETAVTLPAGVKELDIDWSLDEVAAGPTEARRE